MTTSHTTRNSMKSKRGFGIVEAIVAAAIFVIVLTSVAPALLSLIRVNKLNEERAEASYAAQRVFDELRQTNFDEWPNSGKEDTIKVSERSYEYKLTYCTAGSNEFCSGDVRQARVEIFYQGEMVYDVEVVYTDLEGGDVTSTE